MADENKDVMLDVQARWSNVEDYFQKNKKRVSTVTTILLVVIAGYFGYTYWYMPGQEKEAEVAIKDAQRYFGMDSIKKAIPLFESVVDEYGSTKIGHTANYYLGVCYFQMKDYQKAIDYLDKFNAGDIMVSPIAAGLMGDAEMQLGHNDAALEDYLKAIKRSDNELTAPVFLKKAAFVCELKGDYSQALSLYENINTQYHSSQEAQDIEKYIARAKAHTGSAQ
ncbi:MAG TPA: tetratricopeptide repeat protein [Bacteroidia bacterium]|jgi:tetratricopeptide (TPR) repeat protein|nr:tetratricopeptide repeat protein [Bacteroidia bacterium]